MLKASILPRALARVIVLLLLLAPAHAYALSDADYKSFMRESPAFADADKRLDQVWEDLRKQLPARQYTALLAEQRDWLQRGRDAEALAEKDAPTRAAAYAAVTSRRVEALRALLPPASPASPASPDSVAPGSPAASPKNAQPKAPRQTTPSVQTGAADAPPPITAFAHDTEATRSGAEQKGPLPGTPAPAQTPLAGPAPASFVGMYTMEHGELEVSQGANGYEVRVERRSPDKSWTCRASGIATLQGSSLVFHDSEYPDSGRILVDIEGNKMLITRSFPKFCSSGGTLGGVYVKKR